MQRHIIQASHNYNFVCDCCNSYPESYFDWKVTATFYTALHLLRALCANRNVYPGRTHHEMADNLDPRRGGKKVTNLPEWVWKNYSKLQKYSEHARYEVYLDAELENEVQKDNYNHAVIIFKELNTYFEKNGIK